MAVSAEELQRALDDFEVYCKQNHLTINASKTKIMIFGRGRIPSAHFYINKEEIEVVKEFKYLGIVLSPQLSYSNHIDYCVTKAKSRIAYLYLTIPIYEMPLEIVVQIFQVYLLPIFTYCSAIWSYNVNSQNAIQKLNAVFTN